MEKKITSREYLICADDKGNYNTFHKRPRPRVRCAGRRLIAGGLKIADRGRVVAVVHPVVMIEFIDTMRDIYLLRLDYSGLERGTCIDNEILNHGMVKCGKFMVPLRPMDVNKEASRNGEDHLIVESVAIRAVLK
jgi:hypothetical protein